MGANYATPLVDAIHQARLKRQALAGAIRSAQIEIGRTPAATSPDKRARHEVACLERALAELITPPPPAQQTGVDAEINRLMRELDLEDQRQPLEAQLGLAK